MKKLSALMLGMAMIVGSAAFAAQAPKDEATKPSTATTKKTVKKHKKHAKKTVACTTTAATPSK